MQVNTDRFAFEDGTNIIGQGQMVFKRDVIINNDWQFSRLTVDSGGAAIFNRELRTAITGVNAGGAAVFNAGLNARLKLNGGTATFAGNGTGTGELAGTGGTVNITAASPGRFVVAEGNHTFNFGPSQYANRELFSGDYTVNSNATLSTSQGIDTNRASITLVGANSNFPALATLTTNAGRLELKDGRAFDFAPAAGMFVNTGTFVKSGTGTTTIATGFDNTGQVRVEGGALAMTGSVPQVTSGGTVLSGGSWYVGDNATLSIVGAAITTNQGSVTLSGTTSNFSAINALSSNGGTFTLLNGRSFATAGDLADSGSLIVGSSSTLSVSGGLSLSGSGSTASVTVASDTLRPGRLVLGGDLTANATTSTLQIQSASVSATTGAVSASGTGELPGELDLGGATRAFTVADGLADPDLLITAKVVNGGITKKGAGHLRLAGPNTYGGVTAVQAGKLSFASGLAIPTGSPVSVDAGASVELGSFTAAMANLSGAGGVSLNGASLRVGAASSDTSFSGTISGTGSLTKQGAATWTLAGNNNFTGNLRVEAGRLQVESAQSFTGSVEVAGGVLSVGADDHLGASGNTLTLSGGGTLEVRQGHTSTRSLQVTGTGGANAGQVDVPAGQTLTFAGTLAGSGALAKGGAGTVKLASNSSLSGALNVTRGTFSLGGSGALASVPSVSINVDATLELDNTQGQATRLSATAPIQLTGGTLRVLGTDSTAVSQSLGTLTPAAGASSLQLVPGASGGTLSLSFASLGTRGTGATLDVSVADLGNTARVFLGGGMATGFMGSWATVNGSTFASYDATRGIVAMDEGLFTVNQLTPDAFVKLDSSVTTPPVPTDISSNLSIRTLTLATGGGDIGLSVQGTGTTLTLSSGGLIKNGTGAASIGGGTLTSGVGELNVTVEGNPLTLTSTLSGAFTLTKRGEGKLILSGANASNYSGISVISGGLDLSKPAGTNAIPGDLHIYGGTVMSLANEQVADSASVYIHAGTWDLNGKTETIDKLFNYGGTLLFHGGTINAAGNVELSGGTTTVASILNSASLIRITGGLNEIKPSGVVNVGSGGLTFSGTANPSIVMSSDDASPARLALVDTGGVGGVSFDGTSGIAAIRSIGSGSQAAVLDLGAVQRNFTVASAAASLEVEPKVIGGGGIRKAGGGTLVLSGANAYAGGTTIAGGTLEARGTAALGAAGGTVTVASAATLRLRADGSDNAFAQHLTVNDTATVELGRLTPGSTGTMRLGTLSIASGQRLVVQPTTGGNGTGGQLQFDGAVTLGGHAMIQAEAGVTINSVIGQSASATGFDLTKDGAGTLRLAGSTENTYSGTTRVQGGTLELAKPAGMAAVKGPLSILNGATARLMNAGQLPSTSVVSLNGAASTLDLNGYNQTVGGLSFTAGQVKTGSGVLTLGGNVSAAVEKNMAVIQGNLDLANAVRTFDVADGPGATDLEIAALVASTGGTVGGITKTGAGTLLLSNTTNTFAGTITVSGGILRVVSNSCLGDAANGILLSGGSLQTMDNVDLEHPVTLGGSEAANIEVAPAKLVRMRGALAGAKGMRIKGGGTIDLTALSACSFGGVGEKVSVAQGTLIVSNTNQLGNVSNAVELAGGTLRLYDTIGLGVSSPRSVSLAAAGGTVDVPASQATLSGTISGSVDAQGNTIAGSAVLTKSGLGTLNLTGGSNTMGGAVVSGGTLSLKSLGLLKSGVLSGTWEVRDGASLALDASLGSVSGNAGQVSLSGSTASFAALSALSSNTGSLSVTGGKNLALASATFANSGSLSVGGGTGSSVLSIAGTVAQVSGTTLSGGAWTVLDGGRLDLSGTPPLTANAATVTLSGASSAFPRFDTISSNSGSLLLRQGRVFALADGFVNSGLLSVDAASALQVPGSLGVSGSGATLEAQSGLAVGTPQAGGGRSGGGLSIANGGAVRLGSGGKVLVTPSLTLTGTSSTVDLSDGSMVVDYTGDAASSPQGSLRGYLISGYHAGAWDGTMGLRSGGVASGGLTGKRSLGYGEASELLASGFAGGATSVTWMGQSVDATSVLVRLTVAADATLDGKVDFDDLLLLAQNYNSTTATWSRADFTYDGKVDFDDLLLLAQNYNATLGGTAVTDAGNTLGSTVDVTTLNAPSNFAADWQRALETTVPEPSLLGLLTLGMLALGRREGRLRL